MRIAGIPHYALDIYRILRHCLFTAMVPQGIGQMTEDMIERAVEIKIDQLDRLFLRGGYTQAEYDAAIKAVDDWAKTELARRQR